MSDYPYTEQRERLWRQAVMWTGDHLDRLELRSRNPLTEEVVEKVLGWPQAQSYDKRIRPEEVAMSILTDQVLSSDVLEQGGEAVLTKLMDLGLNLTTKFWRTGFDMAMPWLCHSVLLVAFDKRSAELMLETHRLHDVKFTNTVVIEEEGQFVWNPEIHRVEGMRQLFVVIVPESDIETRKSLDVHYRDPEAGLSTIVDKDFSKRYLGVDAFDAHAFDVIAFMDLLVKDRRRGGLSDPLWKQDLSLKEEMARFYNYRIQHGKSCLVPMYAHIKPLIDLKDKTNEQIGIELRDAFIKEYGYHELDIVGMHERLGKIIVEEAMKRDGAPR